MIESLVIRLRETAMAAGIDAMLMLDRAVYLFEKQEKELDMVRAERNANQKAIIDLMEENAVIKKERDALLKQLEIADEYCEFCRWASLDGPYLTVDCHCDCDICSLECGCKDCRDKDKWEWKGVDE